MTISRKVLVIGQDDRSFVSVIRSLGRQDIDVHIATTNSESLGFHSKYVKKTINLPNYADSPTRWTSAFVQINKLKKS